MTRVDDFLSGPVKNKTIFPVLILHLLRAQPDHGYGLMQRIDALCGGLIAVNTNKVYPLLRRLEERGFVTAGWEHPSKRSRRIYTLTPEGLARMERIKGAMLPHLDSIAEGVQRLRAELYGQST